MAKYKQQFVLTLIFSAIYFFLLCVLFFADIDAMGDRLMGLINTAVGVLTAVVPMMLQFWFGSSTGSKDKDPQRP